MAGSADAGAGVTAAQAGSTRFDSAYYRRYYRDTATRVGDRARTQHLGRFVCAYLRHLGQPVRRVLDAGCGLGFWRSVIRRHHPRATYTGLEISEYACARHGWEHGSIVDYAAPAPFDLVICQGVLQYLPDGAAATALDNIARLTRGALYLEALTREDWDENVDRWRTDGDVHLRPGAWYRRRLARHFRSAGGGVFLAHASPVVLFELERG